MKDARRSGSRRRARRREKRPGFRLGIGAGAAIAKLLLAAACSVLVILAIVQRWNVFLLIAVGVVWAAVFAGLIVVPIVASLIADSLGQFGSSRPFPPPDRAYNTDSWAREPWPPSYPASLQAEVGIQHAPSKGPMTRQLAAGMASGFNWGALVQAMADRLETALGEDYSAAAEGSALVIRHGEMLRKVNLGSILQPPPLEVGDRALRGCLKMMDEAQMFAMRVRQGPWPVRESTPEGAPANLARPRVRLDDGEIRMVWADSWGTVLRLRPVPFEAARETGDVSW